MLKRLHLRNFTVFADAEFEFGEGINVLVGANSTGKTHVLKVGYLVGRVIAKIFSADLHKNGSQAWPSYISKRLQDIFQPDKLGDLVSWSIRSKEAMITAEISDRYDEMLSFRFSKSAKHTEFYEKKRSVIVDKYPDSSSISWSIFITPKEALSFAWLKNINELRRLPIDDTYPALINLLFIYPLNKIKLKLGVGKLLKSVEELVGGRVEERGGRFYVVNKKRPVEMNLVAEGLRKFATIGRLIDNGVMTPESLLFWDEPEANLNPALLKDMAVILTDLAQAGFQIILATHSLFLMRELHILAQRKKKPVRYFGLYAGEDGAVQVERQDDLMQLQHLVALDAELAQTFDFEATLDEDYADS